MPHFSLFPLKCPTGVIVPLGRARSAPPAGPAGRDRDGLGGRDGLDGGRHEFSIEADGA
jgi:hypothetical protein